MKENSHMVIRERLDTNDIRYDQSQIFRAVAVFSTSDQNVIFGFLLIVELTKLLDLPGDKSPIHPDFVEPI